MSRSGLRFVGQNILQRWRKGCESRAYRRLSYFYRLFPQLAHGRPDPVAQEWVRLWSTGRATTSRPIVGGGESDPIRTSLMAAG